MSCCDHPHAATVRVLPPALEAEYGRRHRTDHVCVVARGSGMNGSTQPTGYWCEVRAEGRVHGTGQLAQYVLGTFRTISPMLALRWLRGEALRIADRLDPDPRRSPWAQPYREAPTGLAPDGPTGLRMWCADNGDRRAARERIKGGEPLLVAVQDVDCRYTLSVWPVRTATPAEHRWSPPGSQEPRDDRLPGGAAPSLRLPAGRPARRRGKRLGAPALRPTRAHPRHGGVEAREPVLPEGEKP